MANPTREIPRIEGSKAGRTRLLLVEDDESLRRALLRLVAQDFDVLAVADGSTAADLLVRETFDVVLSDIGLPGMSGVDLLRLVRSYDLDVPVVLMTGQPTVDTAVVALELGALTYIRKPFEMHEISSALDRASKLARIARAKREAIAAGLGGFPLAGDRAGLETTFDRALDGLWLAFQPLVDTRSRRTAGFEALMRTTEPTMPNPGSILDAGERLLRLRDLGRRVRERAAAAFTPDLVAGQARGATGEVDDPLLFVNLHPSDLMDPDLYDPGAPLSKIAANVVLEVTERTAIDGVHDIRRRTRQLRDLGYRIALDDLGAGYAGLTSFTTLEPEIVKLDMSLIRGIEQSPVQCRIVECIAKLCRELNMRVVAEGIETPQELGRVLDLGCDYLQGFLLGRPDREPRPSRHRW